MSAGDPTGTPWTDREIELIVADYFDMLQLQRAGTSFVKAHRNAALQELTGRSRTSIEFKHQNISAVLRKLGTNWLEGYPPMANYQRALVQVVARYVEECQDWVLSPPVSAAARISDASPLFFETPPVASETRSREPEELTRLVRKFDPAERDARNRALGKLGEEHVLKAECIRLNQADRPDLADKVRWVSAEDGDGAGYDILSFTSAGEERLLEVKTTTGHQATPFYLTENERSLSVERQDAFRLVRLYDFARSPRAFKLVPPLESSVLLQPTIYRASF